jgi:peroxiredoxin
MKKIVFLALLALTIFSCSKVKKGEYLISGKAKGIANGKMVVLKKQNEFGMVVSVDSAKVKDGKFELKGKVKEPSMLAIFIQGVQQPIPFILETGEIDVKVDKDSIWKSEIGGTTSNNSFQKFNVKLNSIQKKMMAFQNKNMKKFMEAQQKKDNATIEKLKKEYSNFEKEKEDFMNTYPEHNKDSYISLLLVQNMFNSPTFEINKVKKTFNNLDASLKATKIGKDIEAKLKTIENNHKIQAKASGSAEVGKQAPNFSAKNPQGSEVSLKQSLGKVTIIDFWASWCGPCRKEMPNVVAIYNELHSKGLNIIGVSLDKDLTKWNEAIAKDKITWTQVSNLKKWEEPIAKQYGVQQIPTTFILDASGKIIAKDLSGEELKAKVLELLK